jgi:hypothetical protein
MMGCRRSIHHRSIDLGKDDLKVAATAVEVPENQTRELFSSSPSSARRAMVVLKQVSRILAVLNGGLKNWPPHEAEGQVAIDKRRLASGR